MTNARDESEVDEALDDAAQGVSETADDAPEGSGEVDAIGDAAGLPDDDGKPFRGIDAVDARDEHRWELDPDSKEDERAPK